MKYRKNLKKTETRFNIPDGTILCPKEGTKLKKNVIYRGTTVLNGVLHHHIASINGSRKDRPIREKSLENYKVLQYRKRGYRKVPSRAVLETTPERARVFDEPIPVPVTATPAPVTSTLPTPVTASVIVLTDVSLELAIKRIVNSMLPKLIRDAVENYTNPSTTV